MDIKTDGRTHANKPKWCCDNYICLAHNKQARQKSHSASVEGIFSCLLYIQEPCSIKRALNASAKSFPQADHGRHSLLTDNFLYVRLYVVLRIQRLARQNGLYPKKAIFTCLQYKTLWEKEKLLIKSIFFLFPQCFLPF